MPDHVHQTSPLLTPNESMSDTNGWKRRHLNACRIQPIAMTLSAMHHYAIVHSERYGSRLADDYVLGPAFLEVLKGLRVMLNGECGNLDCGTVDGAIYKLATLAGFNLDTGEVVSHA